jgi:hypothetical protein
VLGPEFKHQYKKKKKKERQEIKTHNTYNIEVIALVFLCIQFNVIKQIFTVMQPSLHPAPDHFSSGKT